MTGVPLRNYQERGADLIVRVTEGPPEAHLVACPTGGGKTVVAMAAARRLIDKGLRGAVLVHRDHLVDQALQHAHAWGIHASVIKAGRPYDPAAPLVIASVHTCRVRKTRPDVKWVIGDECHIASVHKPMQEWYSGIPRIGLTATPQLYGDKTLAGFFQHLHILAKPSELLDAGHIVPARIFVPPLPDLAHVRLVGGDFSEEDLERVMGRTEVVGNVVEHWLKHARHLSTLCFAVNRAHARSLVTRFQDAGAATAVITGETPDTERASILAQVRERTVEVLVNVAVFIEGYDLPQLGCVSVARPTCSLALWLQMCGRGCRPSEGKHNFILLDHGGNTFRLRPPLEDRVWSLEKVARKKRAGDVARTAMRQCPNCWFVYAGHSATCPACGDTRPSRWVVEKHGELVDVTDQITQPLRGPSQVTKDLADKFRRGCWAKIRNASMPAPKKAAWVASEMKKFWEEVLSEGTR